MTTPTPLPPVDPITDARTHAEMTAKRALEYKDTHDNFSPDVAILSREPADTDKIGSAALVDYFKQPQFTLPTEDY